MTPKTTAVQHAIEIGYIERRPGTAGDADYESYWQHCKKTQRPFVRVERLRELCNVDADLYTTGQQFTDELHRRAASLFEPAEENPKPTDYCFSPTLAACRTIKFEEAPALAAALFQLACTAPDRPSGLPRA